MFNRHPKTSLRLRRFISHSHCIVDRSRQHNTDYKCMFILRKSHQLSCKKKKSIKHVDILLNKSDLLNHRDFSNNVKVVFIKNKKQAILFVLNAHEHTYIKYNKTIRTILEIKKNKVQISITLSAFRPSYIEKRKNTLILILIGIFLCQVVISFFATSENVYAVEFYFLPRVETFIFSTPGFYFATSDANILMCAQWSFIFSASDANFLIFHIGVYFNCHL